MRKSYSRFAAASVQSKSCIHLMQATIRSRRQGDDLLNFQGFPYEPKLFLRLQYSMEAMTLEWRRRFATERRHRILAFAAIAGLSISFALFWLLFAGVWVILPFTATELACVAAAFWWFEQASEDSDRVEFTDDGVNVIRVRRRRVAQFVFTRNWLVIELVANGGRGPSGVRLRQSGRTVALVEFLPEPEQMRALGELRRALSSR